MEEAEKSKLANMPAVEPCVAALVVSPGEALRPNPRFPSAECKRTDDLIVMAHNTGTLLGRLSNSLAHLLLAMQTSLMGRGEERTQEDLLSSALQTMGYQMHVGTQSGPWPLFQAMCSDWQ